MHLDIQLALAGIGQGALLAVFAVGLVSIYGGSGVLNLGHGAIATLTAYVFLWLINHAGVPTALAFVIGLILASALGAVINLLLLRRLRDAAPLAKVVLTLGILVALTAAVTTIFGYNAPLTHQLLPQGIIRLPFGHPAYRIGTDRLWLLGIAIVMTAAVAAIYRYTRFGLRTRALADSELVLDVTGISGNRVATLNWTLGCGLAGGAGMLLTTLAPLTPQFYTSLMVTAIAAALVGGFRRFGVTFAAAFIIGVAQPVLTRYDPDFVKWTSLPGWSEALPLLAIIIVFVFRGKGLPQRDLESTGVLPGTPRPHHPGRYVLLGTAVAAVAVLEMPSRWLYGATTSLINVPLMLSLVLVVGYVGQVSLAQLSFAGAGAFAAAAASSAWGLPFPFTVILGGLVAVPAGVIFGIPALRVRGVNLAVVTLALALAADDMVFNNNRISGGGYGRTIKPPSLFGLNLNPAVHPRSFAIVVTVIAALTCLLVVWIRSGFLGMRFLAVRANERGAAASGVDLTSTKLLAFAISAFLAGVAGSLLAYQSGTIGPDSFATLSSVFLVAYAYIGGIGSIQGAVLAALLVPVGLVAAIIGINGDVMDLIAGVSMINVIVNHPSGLAGIPKQIRDFRARNSRRHTMETVEPKRVMSQTETPVA